MGTLTFFVGLGGSLILVLGAALPNWNIPPRHSPKDWCFSVGTTAMFAYALLGWLEGAPIFFVFLEFLMVLSVIMMMSEVSRSISISLTATATAILMIWSVILAQEQRTLIFVVGLGVIATGYVLRSGTIRRQVALAVGSACIAFYSYLAGSWIFFGLNVFFATFSLFYVWKTSYLERVRKGYWSQV